MRGCWCLAQSSATTQQRGLGILVSYQEVRITLAWENIQCLGRATDIYNYFFFKKKKKGTLRTGSLEKL